MTHACKISCIPITIGITAIMTVPVGVNTPTSEDLRHLKNPQISPNIRLIRPLNNKNETGVKSLMKYR